MTEIKAGMLVKLKSGGPEMTVKFFTVNGTWLCSWFDTKGELKEADFAAEQLEEVKY